MSQQNEMCPTCGSPNRKVRGIIPPLIGQHLHLDVEYCTDSWHTAAEQWQKSKRGRMGARSQFDLGDE